MSTKLYVGNLNYDTTEEKLKETFEQFGEVVSVNIIGRRGFGFVEMSTKEQAEKAMEVLNQSELDGRNIRVAEAKPRDNNRRRFNNRRRSFNNW